MSLDWMETQCCHHDGLSGGLFCCRSQDGSGRPAHDGLRNLPAADKQATGTWRSYPPLDGHTSVAQAKHMGQIRCQSCMRRGCGPSGLARVQDRCNAAVCEERSSSWGVRHAGAQPLINWHKTPPVPRSGQRSLRRQPCRADGPIATPASLPWPLREHELGSSRPWIPDLDRVREAGGWPAPEKIEQLNRN